MPDPLVAPGCLTVSGRGRRTWLHLELDEPAGRVHFRRRMDRPDRGWLPVAAPDPGRAWRPIEPIPVPTAADLGLPPEVLRGVATVMARARPQAVTDEAGSVFGYHWTRAGGWIRSSCLRLHDPEFAEAIHASVKVAQITGEWDATPRPDGTRRPTLSRSLSTAGIRGTDLGVRFDHDGRSFLLFGDTHWTRPWLMLRDAIAEVVPGDPLPRVRLHGSPLRLVGGGATMGEYDVPLDAASLGSQLFCWFSSNHFAGGITMGRSVLARAEDPQLQLDPASRHRPVRFRVLGTFSSRYFINVSVQRLSAADLPGWAGSGEMLLVWGTGSYRASPVRLAVLDAAGIERLTAGNPHPGWRYFSGTAGGVPVWSDDEADAAALFGPGALGELSVRWIPQVGRFLLLAGSGPQDPIGTAVTLRWADQPWGPWSQRLRLMDWRAVGMSADPFLRFIKVTNDGTDPVAEDLFTAQANQTGAGYAPYFFDARTDGSQLVLRYTLSTWNPYQVVLMEHRLSAGEY